MEKPWRNWWVRVLWTIIMIVSFVAILLARQYCLVGLVIILQCAIFREVLQIAHVPYKARRLPWFRLVSWYFFLAANYYLYGESFLRIHHHRFISYMLYCGGLVLFVLCLKRPHYKFQFSQFAWTHMAILLIVVQGHGLINLILMGVFWFVLPVSLVVVNDVSAYIFGFFLGRTPLIRLSPRKTWEGFVGAAVCTVLWGYLIVLALIEFPYFTCPPLNLANGILSLISCEVDLVYKKTFYSVLGFRIPFVPVHYHTLILSLFASLIAPFGGFFASGLKRAFKIKDFGDIIPGHGGLTDRCDCQAIMGLFTYVYVTTFLGRTSSQDLMAMFYLLSSEDQLNVYLLIKSHLIKTKLL